ncbi:PREDICTED: uncharacterized protein LOC104788956 [Camelina sativa]|uniref:Uncharacterized protein LOC104788956 n=1 Tax=Camelina sativa TaxID=90675 RepID=A0ABM1RP30_CAMSA|nr:PREDICTED: uncharacterized protein LOC104788956 [Camelina sativa]
MKEESIGGGVSSVWQSLVKRMAVDGGSCGEGGDRSRTSCKRIKTTQVNGFIVYTRTRKTKFTKLHEEDETPLENGMSNHHHLEESKPASGGATNGSVDMCHSNSISETNVSGSSCIKSAFVESPARKIAVEERLLNGSLAESPVVETDSSSLVDVVIDDINFVELLQEEIPVEIMSEGSLDFEIKGLRTKVRTMGKSYSVSKEKRHGSFKRTAQIYKSLLRVKKVNSMVPKDVDVLAEPEFDHEGLGEQSHSGRTADKSNLIRRRPETVRDLFETGILDGLPVVYMGTVKSQAFGLRGIIKDGGILCSCSSCDWANVISTSKFEIHASKQYRRASQYICFENGKSLLDVLKISRNTPLHALEATILDAVNSASKEKCFTCKRCKGVFPLSSLGHRGFLCMSCLEVETSQGSPATTRTLNIAHACITSPVKSRLKITRKPSESTSQSPVFMSPLGNSTRKITKKALRQALVGKAYLSASANISSQNKCRSKFKMWTQDSVTSEDFTSVSFSVSSKKRSYRLTKKLVSFVYSNLNFIYSGCLITSLKQEGLLHSYVLNNSPEVSVTFAQHIFLVYVECVSLPSIPRGNWHCKYCEKKSKSEIAGDYIGNSSAVGQVEGVDPLDPVDQLAGRCIRVVKNLEVEINGCVLCSGSDFCRSGFGPRTIIICDQCEKEYHIGCLSSQNIVDLKELPKGNWFCSMDCTRINSTLQKLLLGGAEKLSDSSLGIIRTKQGSTNVGSINNLDIRWRLISGRVTSPESRMLLSQALAIFHDCFDPIVDPISGRNLIPRMVYGKTMQGQDYGGICCAVLTVNATVVTAGLLRVFGREVAELPLVATRMCSREKGYFQLLFSCIEKLLSFLNVESIVVPAAEEAESLWMNKFGFRKLVPEQLSKYIKTCYQMVRFKGSSMLQKPVHSHQVVDNKIETGVSLEENFDLKQPNELYVHPLC